MHSFRLILALAFIGNSGILFAQTGFQITDGMSGSWYDPAKSGQGYTMQVLSEDSALLTWFTYDTEGNQFWMQAVGEIDNNHVIFPDLLRFEGPRFGPDFDPDDRVNIPAGSLTITFDDCQSGVAEYSGSSELPPDTLNLQRLTRVAGFDCQNTPAPVLSGTLHPGLSGAWFDPAQSGQGWMIELLNDDSALVYWFTYDSQGNQRWMLGVGDIDGNGFLTPEMLRPVGGRFGPDFDPDDVVHEPWGVFGLSHVQCQRAVATFLETQTDTFDGFFNVRLLANIGNSDACDFPDGLAGMSGQLVAAANSYTDGTTNDPYSPLIPNGEFQGQSVGNPATITGFAAASPVGFGRFENEADDWDEYQLNLIAGQTVQLIIHDWDENDPGRNDLDLLLFRPEETELLDGSFTTQRNEYLQITESGLYDLAVEAYNGASTYTLHVSYTPVPADAQMLTLRGEFAEDEILVGLRTSPESPQSHSESKNSRLQQLSGEHGLDIVTAPPIGPALLRLQSVGGPVAAPQSKNGSVSSTETLSSRRSTRMLSNYPRRLELIRQIKSLQAREDVEYAHPNYYAFAMSNDPRLPEQWHYNQINVPQAWQITQGDPSVLVAVVDSGVAPHPDLEQNVRWDLGFDAVNRANNSSPRPGDDPPAPNRSPNSHGTHVAGTVAAVLGNNRDGAGVAPNVQIMPVRVLGETGNGSFDQIIDGIYWAAGTSRVSGLANPSRRADVINLSLGGIGPCLPGIQEAINFARNQGVIVVAAAGNESSSMNVVPASCDGVIAVSALNRQGTPAFYSNCGSYVWVAAPGGEIGNSSDSQFARGFFGLPMPRYQPFPSSCRADPQTVAPTADGVWSTNFRYQGQQRRAAFDAFPGTSMAAPHVAGVAALMKSVDPGLTPATFDALLSAGELTDGLGWDAFYGYGPIDARRSVEAVLDAGAAVPGSLSASPAQLSYGGTANARSIDIRRHGSNTGSIDGFFQAEAPWLVSVSALDVDADGYGLWEIGADRDGLLEGEYLGELIVETTTGLSLNIPANLSVGPQSERGDAGFLYLIVLDPLTLGIVAFLGGTGADGIYSYSLDELVPGKYLLISFSQAGFTNIICDRGEFCGFYPGTGQIEPVVLEGGSDIELGAITVSPDYSGVGEAGTAQSLIMASRQERMQTGTLSPLAQAMPRVLDQRRFRSPATPDSGANPAMRSMFEKHVE